MDDALANPVRSGRKQPHQDRIGSLFPIAHPFITNARGILVNLFGDTESETAAASGAAYRVLARKYRPTKFSELIGQDALVRTLTNAFASGRLAHAWMMTGVRGVGKTTTARIIARALNCTGPDGTGGPTIEPCGVCPTCVAIAEDRCVDVIEMDAATHTGIENMREVMDGMRYAPVMARTKVYIIDEVHQLSKHTFNALLKTLEEPPPHVKFVFATTEIRKVPVTVLSRCQRFDLRRVPADTLTMHFAEVCAKGRRRGRGRRAAPDRPCGGRVGARRPVPAGPGPCPA